MGAMKQKLNGAEGILFDMFSGKKSMQEPAESLGLKYYSMDFMQESDFMIDILSANPSDLAIIPDIIWASPPCTTFSVASMNHHWDTNNKPKTKEAEKGILIMKATFEWIEYFHSKNPLLLWFVENPRGKMRKQDSMSAMELYMTQGHGVFRHTVTYCQYGETRMKPTDIWTNNLYWKPRPICKNGDPCHEAAPRSSRTGTQGMKNAADRSIVPRELLIEVLESCKQMDVNQ